MKIFDSASGATGSWYRVVRDVELAYATNSAAAFASQTISVVIGNEKREKLNQNSDRNYTAGFDDVISLKVGMHIRVEATAVPTAMDVEVHAFPGDALMVV